MTDLINNDTQSRVRSLATMNRKLPLIDLDAEMQTGRKDYSSGRIQRERLNEEASLSRGDAIVWSYGKRNRKRLVETSSPASTMRVTTSGEIQGQLRANRPYLKSIALNASTQRLQVALLVEVHFSLRYRTDNPGNTLILSSPTQKAASHWGHPVAILESNRGELREAYVEHRYGNPEPSLPNGLKVGRKVQRLKGEEANLISPYQRPALFFWKNNGDIVRAVAKATGNKTDMSNGFVNKVRQAVTLGCYGVNSGEAYSASQGNPEPSRMNGLRVIRKVQRSEGADAKPINLQQRPALALTQDEKMIRSAWKHAEAGRNIQSTFFQKKEGRCNSYDNLQRFDGGGGTLRMDFTDVKFGEGITWDTHVAIDPDRCYGVNPADINVYELMKFGAYARDTLQMRQYTSGGTYRTMGDLAVTLRKINRAICWKLRVSCGTMQIVTIRQVRTISREGRTSGTLNDYTLGSLLNTNRDEDIVLSCMATCRGRRKRPIPVLLPEELSNKTDFDQWIGSSSGSLSMATSDRKSLLIDLEAAMPTGCKQLFFSKNDGQHDRLSGERPLVGYATVGTHGNVNHERLAEQKRPVRISQQKSSNNLVLGCKYDLGATRFGSHWVLSNLDVSNLPGPAIAFS